MDYDQLIRALACHRAIIFLGMYREPTLDTHRLLLKGFIRCADILLQRYEASGMAEYLVQANAHYKQAVTWSLLSKFRVNFHQDADLARLREYFQPKEPTRQVELSTHKLHV